MSFDPGRAHRILPGSARSRDIVRVPHTSTAVEAPLCSPTAGYLRASSKGHARSGDEPVLQCRMRRGHRPLPPSAWRPAGCLCELPPMLWKVNAQRGVEVHGDIGRCRGRPAFSRRRRGSSGRSQPGHRRPYALAPTEGLPCRGRFLSSGERRAQRCPERAIRDTAKDLPIAPAACGRSTPQRVGSPSVSVRDLAHRDPGCPLRRDLASGHLGVTTVFGLRTARCDDRGRAANSLAPSIR